MRNAIILILFTLLTGQAHSQTVSGVTGTFQHGQSLTISGSSFGSKATAAPVKFDNFESGTVGQNLSGWDLYSAGDGQEPKYSATRYRGVGSQSARSDFTNNNYNSSFGFEERVMTTTVFLDAWMYYDAVSPYSRNFKLWRSYYWSSTTPNFYLNYYCVDQGSHYSQDGGGTWDIWPDSDSADIGGGWHHFQTYYVQSSAGGTNGVVKLWLDGVELVNATGVNSRGAGENAWDTFWVGNYLGHDAAAPCGTYGDANVYWDDVYIDTTQSRAEIGNASIYTNATHREIQIPSAWSTGSITITVNRGSFGASDSVYLFIVDSDGSVSDGYPITFGTTYGGTATVPGGITFSGCAFH